MIISQVINALVLLHSHHGDITVELCADEYWHDLGAVKLHNESGRLTIALVAKLDCEQIPQTENARLTA